MDFNAAGVEGSVTNRAQPEKDMFDNTSSYLPFCMKSQEIQYKMGSNPDRMPDILSLPPFLRAFLCLGALLWPPGDHVPNTRLCITQQNLHRIECSHLH